MFWMIFRRGGNHTRTFLSEKEYKTREDRLYPKALGMRPSRVASEGRTDMQISFIGAGKVGVSLGTYFIKKGRKVGGYYSLSPESAAWAATFTQTNQYNNLEQIISSSDMIFFTVPDDKIGDVWEEAKPYVSGKIIAHCSGIHSSKIFSDIERTGSIAYSIHPLCAISDRETSWEQLGDTLFTIEGDTRNISSITDMFTQMGNRTRIISAEDKSKYHAAASLASNHMTAVFYMAQKLLLDCGFSEKEAREELYQLARGNLKNIHSKGCINALTGPIERNDVDTVKMHLSSLDEEKKAAYAKNGLHLIAISKEKNPDRNYGILEKLLSINY